METLILAFILMLVVIAGMAIGFIVQRKSIAGSCGGIGALGIEKACDCDDPCDDKKARMAEADRKEKEQRWQQNRIH